jgi:hypothetical protein
MQLRRVTEKPTESPDGDRRVRERATPRLAAPARRRSLPWLLLGILLVAGFALAFAVTSIRLSGRQPVLALTRSVPAGHLLSLGDLRVVNVSADAGVAVVPASSESSVLGRPVALPLAAGTLLTTTELGTGRIPPPGWAVVGVALKAGQYPPELAPGDRVLIVTAAGNGASGTGAVGTAPPTPATVVGVEAAPVSSQAAAVVSLQVSEADAQSVAVAASNGAVSIVLVSQRGATP